MKTPKHILFALNVRNKLEGAFNTFFCGKVEDIRDSCFMKTRWDTGMLTIFCHIVRKEWRKDVNDVAFAFGPAVETIRCGSQTAVLDLAKG